MRACTRNTGRMTRACGMLTDGEIRRLVVQNASSLAIRIVQPILRDAGRADCRREYAPRVVADGQLIGAPPIPLLHQHVLLPDAHSNATAIVSENAFRTGTRTLIASSPLMIR